MYPPSIPVKHTSPDNSIMNTTTSLTHHLHTLLPTYSSGAFPEPLTDLATSLYAQSRSKGSALKPEEEIGRAYACAQLAAERCVGRIVVAQLEKAWLDITEASTERSIQDDKQHNQLTHMRYISRLKQRLNLPKIESRPPCPPRVYKKLYQYLDHALCAKEQPPTTPKKPVNVPITPTKSGTVRHARGLATPGTVRTPTRTTLLRQLQQSGTPSRKRKFDEYTAVEGGKQADGVPGWVAPTIRHLCMTFEVPEAVAHTFVAVATLLQADSYISNSPLAAARSQGRNSTDITRVHNTEEGKIAGLVIAVLCVVIERITGETLNEEGKQLAVRELVALRKPGVTARKLGEVIGHIESYLHEESKGWMDMEWWKNISVSEDVEMEDSLGGENEDQEMRTDTTSGSRSRTAYKPFEGGLQGGLGTMMQDRIDWLSEERRQEYVEWKAGMMEKIEQIERQQAIASVTGQSV